MIDPESGRKRALWVLVITLVFSRYQFVWPSFLQTTAAVCEGLDRAWMFFHGVAATLIPDNTKAMINDPDALEPTLVTAFLDYVLSEQGQKEIAATGWQPVLTGVAGPPIPAGGQEVWPDWSSLFGWQQQLLSQYQAIFGA